ncbi:MAG: DUF4388 domain-containing protein [Deltaproteobacteria bacterium]
MQLVSRLGQTTLGDLLGLLHRAGASGVLELIEPHARHAIHLRRGFVQAVESDSVASRLGDVAARFAGVSRPVVERARMFAHQRGLRIGQALVATHAIRPGALDDLLAAQQRERLERLYDLGEAEVRFRVARPLPAGASEQTPLPPREAFHGRPRKFDRDTTAQPGFRAPPRPRPATATASSGPSPHAQKQPPPLRRDGHTEPGPAISGAHRVLGVAPGADSKTLRAAFKRLVLELHPDRSPEASADEKNSRGRKLMAVVEAYRSLRVD